MPLPRSRGVDVMTHKFPTKPDLTHTDRYDSFVATIKTKVAWPLSEKTLDVLIEKQLTQEGHGSLMSVAGRLGIKAEQEKTSWGGSSNSFKPQLITWLKAASKEDRLRLYIELVIDRDQAKAL